MFCYGLESLLPNFFSQRTLFVTGAQGDYKTSFCFALSQILMMKKWLNLRYFYSNVPNVWNDNLDLVTLRQNRFIDILFLLDEGGKFIEKRQQARDFVGFSRKQNVYWLIPSEDAPAKELQKLTVQKVINFCTAGIPLVFYKWSYDNGKIKKNGGLFWFNPQHIFGVYSSGLGAVDDDGILDWIEEKREAVIKPRNRSKRLASSGAIEIKVVVDDGGGVSVEQE